MTVTELVLELGKANVLFVFSSLCGMGFHYLKKWSKGETTSSIGGWFGKDNIGATITTFSAFGAAMFTAINTGIITPDMSLLSVLYAGVTTGFAIDSGFNKGDKPTP
jgi:hypothetical protein